MAARLPACNGKQVMRALRAAGFSLEHVRGSHHAMRSGSAPVRYVTVPVHGSKTLKRATLNSIIKQAGLTIEEFKALL